VRILSLVAAAGLVVTIAASSWAQPPPQLMIDAPPELGGARARLESFERASLSGIVRMMGLDDPGPPMHVILAAENTAAAASVSRSTAGYAITSQGLIVLFPARSPTYPHDTLEDVLRHEVAHVLIGRAAGGQPVPRWFHEGLAMAAERPWRLEDRSRLILELVTGPRLTVDEIDRLFDSEATKPRAYALSAAVVREIIRAHGAPVPAAILRHMRTGDAFGAAVVRAAGRPMSDIEREFWSRQRVWTVWVPLFTSGEVLWLLVIALAALAWWRRRGRAAQIRRRWDEEAAAAAAAASSEARGEHDDR
jgi:hypothetical protein